MVNEKELKELNDIEHYRHEAQHDYPGTLDVENDMPAIVAGLNGGEMSEMHAALIELDEESLGRVIINTIQRQCAEQIEALAEEYLAGYLEGLKEDSEDAKDEVRGCV